MKSSGIDHWICTPRFAISENRENFSSARRCPSLVTPVSRDATACAHVERRGRLGAVPIEPVAEIAMSEECGERSIGIWKLPGLDRRHHVVGRHAESVAPPPSDAHVRRNAMAEILVVPVKGVRAPNDSHHRRIQVGGADAVVKDGPDEHRQPFDAVVSFPRAENETAGTARSRPQPEPLGGRIRLDCVDGLRTKESGSGIREQHADRSHRLRCVCHVGLIPSSR